MVKTRYLWRDTAKRCSAAVCLLLAVAATGLAASRTDMEKDVTDRNGHIDHMSDGSTEFYFSLEQGFLRPEEQAGWYYPLTVGKVKTWGTPILGEPELSAEQMENYLRSKNPHAPNVARLYIDIGRDMGIRGDIAFAQTLLETGFFRYGGDVVPEQNNFSGLGTTGRGVRGYYFATPQDGVRAQLEHLWAYATTRPAPRTPIDPRFNYVTRGSCPTWEELGGRWAYPGYAAWKYASFEEAFAAGETYGQLILRIYEDIKNFNG